jgi:hypothetical protein
MSPKAYAYRGRHRRSDLKWWCRNSDFIVGMSTWTRAELPKPVRVTEVEADSRVDASLPEVPVQGSAVVVLVVQLAQVADVGADADRALSS